MRSVHVLRKPLPRHKSVADCLLAEGTGVLNIEASREPYPEGYSPPEHANVDRPSAYTAPERNGDRPYILNSSLKTRYVFVATGRFPANIVYSHVEGCGPSSCASECPVAGSGGHARLVHQVRKVLVGGSSS
jgi:hypothetical protein